MNIGAMLRRLLVSSFCMMWMSGVVLASEAKTAVEVNGKIRTGDIYIPLSIFITLIAATAVFTWTVAKYDNKKVSEITELRHTVERFMKEQK